MNLHHNGAQSARYLEDLEPYAQFLGWHGFTGRRIKSRPLWIPIACRQSPEVIEHHLHCEASMLTVNNPEHVLRRQIDVDQAAFALLRANPDTTETTAAHVRGNRLHREIWLFSEFSLN